MSGSVGIDNSNNGRQDMEQMTDSQFKTHESEARRLGYVHGLRDRADMIEELGHGQEVGDDYDIPGPLSGEWASDLTPSELMYRLGLADVDPDDVDALCEAFESAHTAALFGSD